MQQTLVPAAAAASNIALCLLLGACGPAELPVAGGTAQAAAPAAPSTKDQAPAEKNAPAEAVARQARGPLSCPPRSVSPPRTADAPVDDVLGVRPGLAYEEAMNAVLCSHELLVAGAENGRGFQLQAPEARSVRQGFSARFAEPRVQKSSKQILQDLQRDAMARGANAAREDLKPGQAKWFVGTMGPPGQERVLSVAREERFAADQSPTVASVAAALLKKYGPPTLDRQAGATLPPLMRWAYDPDGRRVNEGSPLFHRCVGASDPDASIHLAPECGLVVQAMVLPLKSNPELVDRLQVGVVHQSGGFQMIAATERALAQSDRQRRAQEVEQAAKNTKPPSL